MHIDFVFECRISFNRISIFIATRGFQLNGRKLESAAHKCQDEASSLIIEAIHNCKCNIKS